MSEHGGQPPAPEIPPPPPHEVPVAPPVPPIPPVPPAPKVDTSVPWGPLESVLVGVLAVVAGSFLGAGLILATGTLHSCGGMTVFGLVGTEAGLVATVVFWVRYVKRAPLSLLGFPRRPVGDVVTGLAGGLILYVGAVAISAAVVALVTVIIGHEPSAPQQVESCVSGPWFVLTGIVASVLAPIGEETLFRGFIFQGLRTRFPLWGAVLLDGFLFGLIHIPFWLIVPSLAAVGCGLAIIYNRRHSLLASMTAHCVFNVIGVLAIELDRVLTHAH
jgi:membrane protease YdiL (CAAX protease family)